MSELYGLSAYGLGDFTLDNKPILYDDNQIEDVFIPPQFTRVRHRYNGVRESYKVNIHADQMYMSIGKLYNFWNQFKTDFQVIVDNIENGVELPDVKDANGKVNVIGLQDISSRIKDLKYKVSVLENMNG